MAESIVMEWNVCAGRRSIKTLMLKVSVSVGEKNQKALLLRWMVLCFDVDETPKTYVLPGLEETGI